ncbi:MAG: hypothetical protein QFF03_20980 [Pseudomonadota bacterium]|nr:hypothetical protein [Pseudomonadota bacterium]
MNGLSMHLFRSTLLIAALCTGAGAAAADVKSYFPVRDLGRFLVANFDVASIRSSLGPRRSPAQRTFASLGELPTKVSEDLVEFDRPDWYYAIRILRRADINNDGIEDLEVCFIDQPRGATYHSQQALLITRYSDSSLAVALKFEVDGCETFAR